ncbi:hypothetical protein [Aquabacter spiritensis]|uniref:PXPV repeat-containing protein n=1 Tax=Aquabacter spiritensis TaxID=933073 RepID=A0A4R3LMC4_9HYPH|nr:hypothetical protein [Aquabacter spiritensis]TCT01513.1 hypothetical protein EDC64_11811 [Aquabacter spiritensis]
MIRSRLAFFGLCVGLSTFGAAPSQAVVYCTGPGYPVGCVVRPAPAVVHCTRPGYPAGCVANPGGIGVLPGAGAGAAGVGLAPGAGVGWGANAGGPVNRAGVR